MELSCAALMQRMNSEQLIAHCNVLLKWKAASVLFFQTLLLQFLPNVKVEVVVYEQNGQRSFKLLMILEGVSNRIE